MPLCVNGEGRAQEKVCVRWVHVVLWRGTTVSSRWGDIVLRLLSSWWRVVVLHNGGCAKRKTCGEVVKGCSCLGVRGYSLNR